MALLNIIHPSQGIPNAWVLAGVIVGLFTSYHIGLAIYNLYFHPLAKFPGPKIASVSNLWYAMALSRGTAPMDMHNFHKRYGPVVRVAPDELSFSSPAAWKEIYGHKRPGHPELTKDKKYHTFLGEPILINADREYHGTLRKLLSHGFSENALRQQEPVLQEHLSMLISRIRSHGVEGEVAIDVLQWYNSFTFDVIGYLTYGESFDCLKSSRIHPFIYTFLSFLTFASFTQVMQRLPAILKLPYAKWSLTKSTKDGLEEMKGLSQTKVRYRLENAPKVPDFMGKLVEAYHDGKMSFNQLVGNSDILLGAGSETTATLLSGLTYLLMQHPRVLDKLTREVRQEFSSSEEITLIGVNKCTYLLACIKEALRVYPPSPATHPRYTPAEGMTIDGEYVPGNMAVGVTILAASKSPLNFRDAEEFVPERWTGEDPRYEGDKKEASQPFSHGPRNCAGQNLAYLEMKLIIASMVWHFDLENCEKTHWLDQKVFMVWNKRPLMVKFKPVQRG